jgi:hypothetical protein
LYSSLNNIRQIKSRRMRWEGGGVCIGEERKMCKVLVRKPEGKRPLEGPKRRWEDGIRLDLGEIGWGMWSGFNWLRIWARGGLF